MKKITLLTLLITSFNYFAQCTLDYEAFVTDESCIGAFNGVANVQALYGTPPYSYLWTDGETTPSRGDLAPGFYEITITDDDSCQVSAVIQIEDAKVDCNDIVPHVYVPSAFSPNHDGENDILYVRGDHINSLDFVIFNKNGNKVFESQDITEGWNGTSLKDNQESPSGVYTFRLSVVFVSSIEQVFYGNVTLVR